MKFVKFSMMSIVALSSLFSCRSDDDSTPPESLTEEVVISANRGSGDITFIDANTDEITTTLSIPDSQPMYVVYVPKTDRVYVGDRSQNVVHIIDPDSREVVGEIAVGEGVFHMWADEKGKQLWVNNDIDNTTSVIDLSSNTVVATIEIGIKPHDVFVSKGKAYVSILAGDATVADSVYLYDTKTYEKVTSMAVGDDPHLFNFPGEDKLYVPCQSGGIFVLDDSNLSFLTNIPVDGSHGIFSADGETVYVTDLPGAELYALDVEDDETIGEPLASTIPIPHNLVVNVDNSKLFVTHSGATADKVTVYDIDDDELSLSATLTAGTNPFGIAYYKRKK